MIALLIWVLILAVIAAVVSQMAIPQPIKYGVLALLGIVLLVVVLNASGLLHGGLGAPSLR